MTAIAARRPPLKLLDLTVTGALIPIDWPPDGKAIDLTNAGTAGTSGGTRSTVDLLSVDRIHRAAAIRSFDWSADGRLVVSRGESKTDLVLFRRAGGR